MSPPPPVAGTDIPSAGRQCRVGEHCDGKAGLALSRVGDALLDAERHVTHARSPLDRSGRKVVGPRIPESRPAETNLRRSGDPVAQEEFARVDRVLPLAITFV